MFPIEVHKVECERNGKVVRSGGIERDIEIGVTHQFGANRAETSLGFIYSDKLIIRSQSTCHHLSQLIARVVDKDAQVGGLAWIEEAIAVVVVEHD